MNTNKIPAGVKKLEFCGVVYDALGNIKSDVAPILMIGHRNPFMHIWLNLGVALKLAGWHIKRAGRKLWSKLPWHKS